MSLFADELISIERNINHAVLNIEKQHKLLDDLMVKYNKLEEHRENYMAFLIRYAAFIGGPDGIFGVLSDEIVVLILSYLPPKQLLECCCKRFHTLRDYALALMPCKIPKEIVDKCVKVLRIPPIIIYTHAKRGTAANNRYVPGTPLILALTLRGKGLYGKPMNYKYEITETNITLYMDIGLKSLVKIATIYNESVVTYESSCIVMMCKDFGFRVVDMNLKPIDMHPMFDLYNKREIN
jgi:hypothetical protein